MRKWRHRVTHCRIVARAVVHDHLQYGSHPKQLRLAWVIREPEIVEDLPFFEGYRDMTFGMSDDTELAMSSDDGFSSDGEEDDPKPLPFVNAEVYITNDTPNAIKKSLDNTIRNGLPNMDRIVQEMKWEAMRNGVTHIAAFVCGPRPLTDALREACRKKSKGMLQCWGVTIDILYSCWRINFEWLQVRTKR